MSREGLLLFLYIFRTNGRDVFFSSSLRAKKISASCELARGASLAYMIDVFYSELQFFFVELHLKSHVNGTNY